MAEEGGPYEGLCPTPVASDWKGSYTEKSMKMHNGRDQLLRSIPAILGVYNPVRGGETFHLSPLFTEEMMGFPFLWVALPFLSPNGKSKV